MPRTQIHKYKYNFDQRVGLDPENYENMISRLQLTQFPSKTQSKH